MMSEKMTDNELFVETVANIVTCYNEMEKDNFWQYLPKDTEYKFAVVATDCVTVLKKYITDNEENPNKHWKVLAMGKIVDDFRNNV